MQFRIALAVLALVVTACSGNDGGSTSGAFSSSQTEAAAKSTTATNPGTDEPAETTTAEPATSTTATATQAPTTTTTEPPSSPLGSRNEPLPVGSVAQVGDWVIRVSSVTADGTDDVMAHNEFNDPPGTGEQFFVAALDATYVGTEPSTFWFDVGLAVVGPSNVAYDSFDAWCGSVPDDITSAGETFQGGTISGSACWKIDATDADDLVLIAEPLLLFGDEGRAFLSLDATATALAAATRWRAAGRRGGRTDRR